jgi:hypothetical protein
VERRAKMGDGGQRRDSVHGRTGNHRSTDPVGIAGSYSATHISYTYGRTGNIIRVGSSNRESGKRPRLPDWYHWAIVAVSLAGFFIVAIVGMVYGG